MSYTYQEIQDLITSTLYHDVKNKVANVNPTRIRRLPLTYMFLMQNKASINFGRDLRFTVNVAGKNTGQWIRSYHVAERSQTDHLAQLTSRCKIYFDHWAFDLLEEDFNSGTEQIVDLIRNRDQQTQISIYEMIERALATFADTNEPDKMQGLLYHLPYCSTEGFVGTYPGSHTDWQGVNVSNSPYTGMKSYGAQYSAVTEDDLFAKARLASEKTRYESPLPSMLIGEPGSGPRWHIFTEISVKLDCEDYVKGQNDSVGWDIDAGYSKAMFHGNKIEAVPAWESGTEATRKPFMAVNAGEFKFMMEKGWWMKRKTHAPNSTQPTVINNDIHCSGQLVCFNRSQAGFNIAKAAS